MAIEYLFCAKCDRLEHVEDLFESGKVSVENVQHGIYVKHPIEDKYIWMCDDCAYCDGCGHLCASIDGHSISCECPMTCPYGANQLQIYKIRELADILLMYAQNIHIREVQLLNESDWSVEYKEKSNRDWNFLNAAHKDIIFYLTGK